MKIQCEFILYNNFVFIHYALTNFENKTICVQNQDGNLRNGLTLLCKFSYMYIIILKFSNLSEVFSQFKKLCS